MCRVAPPAAEPKFLYELARVLTPTSFSPHTFVVEKGQLGQEMFFITAGFVEMMVREMDD